ncbi:MAG: hypothetical protein LBH54_05055, partial [Clostridiales bacterium]|nr:hypothetical protein [Clostridiales bacterium]
MMKFSKKATALGAFVLGAAILTTAAFADVMIGSGYYGFKNSVKATMAALATETDNFTVTVAASVKVDGKEIAHHKTEGKYDMAGRKNTSTDVTFDSEKTYESYRYRDEERLIILNGGDYDTTGVYHVYSRDDWEVFENPFDDERAGDAEKIADAFVGNLQDTIQAEEIDGKKMYTGNLSDAQVPPLVNAISSFVM